MSKIVCMWKQKYVVLCVHKCKLNFKERVHVKWKNAHVTVECKNFHIPKVDLSPWLHWTLLCSVRKNPWLPTYNQILDLLVPFQVNKPWFVH